MNNNKIYNISLLTDKGLCENGEINQKYNELFKKYKILLEKYLLEKFHLKFFDDMLVNSGLNFAVVKKEDMDYYQNFSSMGLKYIYLRNDLYVEHLSTDDINILLNVDFSSVNSMEHEIFSLIERTFLSVINSNNGNIPHMNCYGIDSDYYWKNSNELVFGVRHDHFAKTSLSDEQWRDNYYKQVVFLTSLIDEMNSKCSDILGSKVNFLQYDQYSVNVNKGGRIL